ncbi:NAD(P)-dependent oxidoreductase [Kitasatospora sp. NPDC096147]|uniref:NAD(P)-dependent oxidoreductase n=1 Tax=Kitasatospora sp. NPDC096147 TaxID=3364093 RepID=UPI003804D668
MRLLLVGATGGTGAQVLSRALTAGHQVTVLVRDPSRLTTAVAGSARVVTGDVLSPGDWRTALSGQDAVVSCLGATDGRGPTRVYSRGTAHLVEAMREHGVPRLLCLSSAGLDDEPDVPWYQRLVIRLVVRPRYRHAYADMAAMEAALAAVPEPDWTVVRAPMLTDGPFTGRYRTAVGDRLTRPGRIARADLAHYLLAALDDPATHRAVVEISG